MTINNFISNLLSNKVNSKSFAILVDDSTKQKLFIKALQIHINSFKKLKEEDFYYREKSLRQLSRGDVIVFGTEEDGVDFTILSDIAAIKKLKVGEIYSISEEYTEALDAVTAYVKANYPTRRPVRKPAPKYRVTEYSVNIPAKRKTNVEVEVEIELPYRAPKKKKAKTSYQLCDVVKIHDNFVKIGYDIYPRYIDTTGDDFIIIDNTRCSISSLV